MKKKLVSSLLITAMMVSTVFCGCGNAKSQASKGSQSIVIWTNLENETKILQQYGDKFEKETGNKVKVVHQTADLQKFAQAAKSADGHDGVYGIANDQLAGFVTAGLVQEAPKDAYKDDDYVKASTEACLVNGKRYAAPIAVETNTLFYNTDKIKSVPATFEELVEAAKGKGGIKFDATSIYYDLGFLRAYDSYIFKDSNGKYDVNDIGLGNDGAVKAYTFINKLANEYKYVSSDITSDLAKSSFQSGEAAFYIGGPWDIAGFKSAGTHFAVCEMPTLNGKKFVTPVGTQVGFVSSKSKKQDTAWKFYEYLMKNSEEELYKAGGRIPASKSAQDKIEKDDATKAFIAQINNGEPMPTVAELGQVWTPYQDNMKLMFQKKSTPKDAAKNIEKLVKEGISLMSSGK